MQISNKSVAFTVRVPLAVGTVLANAQRPGLTYRQMAQQAIMEYARKLANADTEKTMP